MSARRDSPRSSPAGFPRSEIKEHFIGDDGHLSRGTNGIQPRDFRLFRKVPVGLLGWTTITPRVRGVMAAL